MMRRIWTSVIWFKKKKLKKDDQIILDQLMAVKDGMYADASYADIVDKFLSGSITVNEGRVFLKFDPHKHSYKLLFATRDCYLFECKACLGQRLVEHIDFWHVEN